MLHLDNPCFQLIATARAAAGLGLGFGIGHYPCYITLGEHAESMGGHDGEEELIYLAQRQRGVRHHADLALHARIDDERLAAELADLIDEGAYVGVLEIDRPAILASIAGLDAGFGGQQGQGGGQQAGGD